MDQFGIFGSSKVETLAQNISRAEDAVNKAAPGNSRAAAEALLTEIEKVSYEDRKAVFDRVKAIDSRRNVPSHLVMTHYTFTIDDNLAAKMLLEDEEAVRAATRPADRAQAITTLDNHARRISSDNAATVMDLVKAYDERARRSSLLRKTQTILTIDWTTEQQLERQKLLMAMPDAEREAERIATAIKTNGGTFGATRDELKNHLKKFSNSSENASELIDAINDKLNEEYKLNFSTTHSGFNSEKETYQIWVNRREGRQASDRLSIAKDLPLRNFDPEGLRCSNSVDVKPGYMDWIFSPFDTYNKEQERTKQIETANNYARIVEQAEQAVRDSSNNPGLQLKAIDSLNEVISNVPYTIPKSAVFRRVREDDKAANKETLVVSDGICGMRLSENAEKIFIRAYDLEQKRMLVEKFPDAEKVAASVADIINRTGSFGTAADQDMIQKAFVSAQDKGDRFAELINERLRTYNSDPKTQYSVGRWVTIGQETNLLRNDVTTTISGPRLTLYRGPQDDTPDLANLVLKGSKPF